MPSSQKDRDAAFDKALTAYTKLSRSKGRLVELDWRDVYRWLQHLSDGHSSPPVRDDAQQTWSLARDAQILSLLQELTIKDYATAFGAFRFEGWIGWLKKGAKTANRKLLARGPDPDIFVGAAESVGRFLLRVPMKCPVKGDPAPDRTFAAAPIETELWTLAQLQEAVDPEAMKKPTKPLTTVLEHLRGEGTPLTKHNRHSQKVFGKASATLETLEASDDSSLFVLPSTLGRFAGATRLSVRNAPLLFVPSAIGELQALQTLQIQSTLIRQLPGEVGDLSQLTHLDLSGNLDLETLPSELAGLDSLIRLDLSHCANLQFDIGLLGQLRSLYEINLPPHTTEAEWMDLQDSLPACIIRVMRFDPEQQAVVNVVEDTF